MALWKWRMQGNAVPKEEIAEDKVARIRPRSSDPTLSNDATLLAPGSGDFTLHAPSLPPRFLDETLPAPGVSPRDPDRTLLASAETYRDPDGTLAAPAIPARDPDGTLIAPAIVPHRDSDATLIGPATLPARDPDGTLVAPPTVVGRDFDRTLIAPIGETRDADGTLIAPTHTAAPSLPKAGAGVSPVQDMHAAIASAMQPQAPAPPAQPRPAPAEKAAPRPSGPRHGGLIGGLAADLVADGALPERKAVSLALRAREQGTTFFRALAQEFSGSEAEPIYEAMAHRLGRDLIRRKTDLLEQIEEEPWCPLSAVEERGIVLLRDPDPKVAAYAALDPCDLPTRHWIARCSGRQPKAIPVLPAAFFDALSRLRTQAFEGKAENDLLVPIDISWREEEEIRERIDTCDVPLIVDYILHRSHEQGASDIHIEPTEEGMLVRNRIDGILHEEMRLGIELHAPVTARIKILAGMDVAEKRRPQDGRITALIRKKPLDIRVSTFPTVSGEKLVMRLLDENAVRPTPEKLGMRDNYLRLLLDKITAPHGLILISGPTGSGKTTTLYSCLSAIDRYRRNVLTVEDPVEYRLKGVHQMQVNEKIGLTFANGLRNILRQDPDVIMVGECRDVETTRMAIQAALTGHVVFSTIHANDATGVISRLLDMQIDPFLVASAVSLPMAQRLLRSMCQNCKTAIRGTEMLALLRADGVSDEKLVKLGIQIDPEKTCLHSPGCQHCRFVGFAGRQPVFEMFEINEEMRAFIMSDHFDSDTLRKLARKTGMATMVQGALQLVDEGRTTFAEVIRVFGDGI